MTSISPSIVPVPGSNANTAKRKFFQYHHPYIKYHRPRPNTGVVVAASPSSRSSRSSTSKKHNSQHEASASSSSGCTTIYGSSFSPISYNNKRYFVACTSSGCIAVWDIQQQQQQHRSSNTGIDSSLPILSITVPGKYSQPYYDNNNNVLYDLQFIQADNGNHLLVVSGDPGILIYKWSDIEAAISAVLDATADDDDDDDDVTTATNNNKKPMMMCQDPKPNTTNLIENIIPITTFTPHPSTAAGGGGGGGSESIEINSTSYNSSNNLLFGAAGGFFGCYTWDLSSEKLLGTFGRAAGGGSGNGRGGRGGGGHHDYLHVVKSLPETSTIGSKTYVITGGEDGNMGFWDGRDQTLIEMVNMQSVMDKKKDLVTTTTASSNTTVSNSNRGFMSSTTTSSATPWNGSSNLWVSSMDTCGDWLAVCGGCENAAGSNNMSLTSRSSGPGTSGYTTLWHLPTRTFTSGCVTRESVNAVIYNPTLDNFVSGGNEGRVSYWESTSLNRSGRSWSTPPAAYTMAVDSESNIMVVGGSGGILDCFVDRVKISQLQV